MIKYGKQERITLKHNTHNFVGLLTVMTLVFGANCGQAAVPTNPRGASSDAASVRSNSGSSPRIVQRTASNNLNTRGASNRNATNSSMGTPGRVSARGAVVSNAMRGGTATARTGVVTGVHDALSPINTNRSATPNVSRAGVSRATAVFNDISKIGGGYANCRDAYATCMDQFCANANDQYRRCFCSSKYSDFRDTEDALDQAKTLLMQFEDNNLNAVDKTAAEVNAMYSATVGEAAIKKDTSGAAKILDQVGDLLSGKKSTTASKDRSLGLISIDTISGEIDDVWGDGGDSIFSNGSGKNLSELEGTSLYNASNKQCMALIGENCSSDAVLQMARSSYSIMISQDCNAYEKKINSQKENLKQTVRTAEKYLRDARLDEYRAHNSADVNECISKVRSAILVDTACGDNYKRCLDNTGAYINVTTGEPIYSPRLFQLTNVITLAGAGSNVDVLRQNQSFDKFLDTKRVFAESALDTCRDKAETVWTEFKKSALIEIAQAQDEKIEEVKMSCVSTMAECYDTTTNALKEFDTTTAQAAGAAGAVATRAMCADKIATCAALYNNGQGCSFGSDGKMNGDATKCGLTALLNFVETVDTTRVAEACGTSITNYIKSLCTPSSGSDGYPWNCRLRNFGSWSESAAGAGTNSSIWTYKNNKSNLSLIELVVNYAFESCGTKKSDGTYDTNSIDRQVRAQVEMSLNDLYGELSNMMSDKCDAINGIWLVNGDNNPLTDGTVMEGFYTINFGKSNALADQDYGVNGWGKCYENSAKAGCELENARTGSNGYVTYDESAGVCRFTMDYYRIRCLEIPGSVWSDNTCFVEDPAWEPSKNSATTKASSDGTGSESLTGNTGEGDHNASKYDVNIPYTETLEK